MTAFSILLSNQLFRLDRARSWQDEPGSLGWSYAHSCAFVCPKCLERWAILAFEGDEELHIHGEHCEKHSIPAERELFRGRPCWPGSLFGSAFCIDLPLLAALPEPLLRREFDLTMKKVETEHGISAN